MAGMVGSGLGTILLIAGCTGLARPESCEAQLAMRGRLERIEPEDAPEGMIWVPGGRALLGSEDHYPEERPVVARQLEGFWMDRFEVTNDLFAAFVEATGYVTTAERPRDELPAGSAVFLPPADGGTGWRFVPGADWRHPEGPDSSIEGRRAYPVVQVSQEDALAFATWAGRALPSEAQWEYAARGGLEAASGPPRTPSGEPAANTWQGYFPLENQALDGYRGRAPVGSYPADGRGFFDLVGNVWEWTRSPYYPTHEPSPTLAAHDRGWAPRHGDAAVAVIKGGSYLCSPVACRRYRAAARHAQEIDTGTNHLGFRTILEPGALD